VGPRAGLGTGARGKILSSARNRTPIARKSNPYPDTILTELPWLLIILTTIIRMDLIIKTIIIIITKYFL
jgi:hypothetical protein